MIYKNLKVGESITGFVNDYIDGPYGRQYIIKNDGGEYKLPTHKMLVEQLPAFNGKKVCIRRENNGSRREAVVYKIRVVEYTSLDSF